MYCYTKKGANALFPWAGINSKYEYEQSATQVLIEFFSPFFLALILHPADEGTQKVSMISRVPLKCHYNHDNERKVSIIQ